MILGAVFDMDGLMIDSERMVYQNWQELMDEYGYDYNIEIFKQTVGRRKKEVELFYLETYGADFPYKKYADMTREKYLRQVRESGVPVKKGLYEILDHLKERGIKLALATSTSRETTEINLSMTKTLDYFDALVCGNEVVNGKPHPEVFLTAAKKLGLDPADCVAFEDSLNGIRSAHAAGMITVMVPDFLQPTEDVLPMIDILCESLDQSIDRLDLDQKISGSGEA